VADLTPPVAPFEVSDLDLPGPLISKAQSGRVNLRATQQYGFTWVERYMLHMGTITHRLFLTQIRTLWRNGTTFSKTHPDYLTMKGVGGGAADVVGASQTGSTLNVNDGPTTTTDWLRAGDIFRVAGLPQVLQCAADVDTDGSGAASISLVVPLFTGGSPADGADLTITGVKFDLILLEPPTFPTTSGRGADWGELVLTLSEAL
jgi:hypothetical protein